MKKLLYTFLAVSLIFSACEKEEEEPTNNTNNNNSSLTFEETIWEVTSFVETYSSGQTFTINIPCTDEEGCDTGINKIEWFFFNNEGFFVEKWVDGYNQTDYDTSYYCYDCFPNNDNITLTALTGGGLITYFGGGDTGDTDLLNIIEHSSNNLVVEYCDSYSINNCVKIYLTKVN